MVIDGQRMILQVFLAAARRWLGWSHAAADSFARPWTRNRVSADDHQRFRLKVAPLLTYTSLRMGVHPEPDDASSRPRTLATSSFGHVTVVRTRSATTDENLRASAAAGSTSPFRRRGTASRWSAFFLDAKDDPTGILKALNHHWLPPGAADSSNLLFRRSTLVIPP